MWQSSALCLLFCLLAHCARAIRLGNDGALPVRGDLVHDALLFIGRAWPPSLGRQRSVRVSSEGGYCDFRKQRLVMRRSNTAMDRIQQAVPRTQGMKVGRPAWMTPRAINGRTSLRFAELFLLSKNTRRA